MRLLTILLLFGTLTTLGQSIDTTSQIDKIFSSWNNSTPGGSVLVARGEKVLYHKAYGLADMEHNAPNTTETIFEAGSVSKQFTAFSILLLMKDGKLSLTDDVRKYIPELPVYESPITIQHLLNHTSGLKDWGSIAAVGGWPRGSKAYTNDLALQIICRQKSLNFKPGAEYSYSNSNYTLQVHIVERISKQSHEEFTKERIFKPVGMNHTRWRSSFKLIIPNRANAYYRTARGYELSMPFENTYGHGGLLTTTGDLLKWNRILETNELGGAALHNVRIEPGRLNAGNTITYAAGIQNGLSNGFQEIAHSGATAGYRAWLAYYPQKKLSVIILSNDGNLPPVTAGHQISDLFLGTAPTISSHPTAIEPAAADVARWSGTYRSIRNFDVINLTPHDQKIMTKGRTLTFIHPDTLALDNNKWAFNKKKGTILIINGTDTSSYRKVNPAIDKNLAAYAGSYSSEETQSSFVITLQDNKLWIAVSPVPPIELKPVYKDAFQIDGEDLVEFRRNSKGQITGFEISVSRAEKIPYIKIK